VRTRPESGAKSRIRILTYNILLGGERREERIASVLAHSGADLIALQEVRDNGMVARLAGELGMAAVSGPPSDGGSLGLAVLTRLPSRPTATTATAGCCGAISR